MTNMKALAGWVCTYIEGNRTSIHQVTEGIVISTCFNEPSVYQGL